MKFELFSRCSVFFPFFSAYIYSPKCRRNWMIMKEKHVSFWKRNKTLKAIFRSPDILATLWSLYFLFFFFSLLVYFGHSNCGFLKVKQHWASSVLGWVTIWLGYSNPSIGTSFIFFTKIWKIFQYDQIWKIFNFYKNLKNLQFWQNFKKSSY